MATAAKAKAFTGFEISPMTPRIGAEISGVCLGEELTDEVIAEIRQCGHS